MVRHPPLPIPAGPCSGLYEIPSRLPWRGGASPFHFTLGAFNLPPSNSNLLPFMIAPQFRELDTADCRDLLRRLHVGRIAYVDHNRVDIEPLSFVGSDDWIFCRTVEGTKTQALRHAPYVAFEVDEVNGPFDWRSVVVHGTVYFLPAQGIVPPIEEREFNRAVAALRQFLPETLKMGDPVPFRTVVFGIHIDAITGRAAAGGSAARKPSAPKTTKKDRAKAASATKRPAKKKKSPARRR